MVMMLLLAVTSLAANTGVVVLLADGTLYTDCVHINDGGSAYDAFQQTTLDMTWQNFGFGYFLESVEGVASNADTGEYWSFWHINSAGTGFEAAMVGASDYEISTDDKVIGISYTAFDASFNPITEPPFSSYDSLCDNPIEVDSMKSYVDDDKDSIDEGDTIDVKPGSELLFVFKVENLDNDLELEDVEIEGIIEDIDDGDDLEEESDSTDINEDDKEEIELKFKIPLEVDEGKYDLIVTVTGERDIPYRQILEFKVDVDKESHEVIAIVPDSKELFCGRSFTFDVKTINIGKDDEEVTLKITNQELEIDVTRTFEVDETDSETKSMTIRVPSDTDGVFDLQTTVQYSDQREEYHTTLNVDCEQEDSGDEQLLYTTVTSETFEVMPDISQESETIKTNYKVTYIVLLVLANIVLLGLIIFLVIK